MKSDLNLILSIFFGTILGILPLLNLIQKESKLIRIELNNIRGILAILAERGKVRLN